MDLDDLKILQRDVVAWNAWRKEEGIVWSDLSAVDLSAANLRRADLNRVNLSRADLSDADLSGADLSGANLSEADLRGANLRGANFRSTNFYRANLIGTSFTGTNLREADFTKANLVHQDLRGADLRGVKFAGADLVMTNFTGAILTEAILFGADLTGANLRGAKLGEADLEMTKLVGTDIRGADLTNCRIYGISVWRLMLDKNTKQQNLIITSLGEPTITIDNIEVAQFVYLLLHNEKIRDVIGTIGKKAVLILGCFSIAERKAVLDALRDALRKHDLLPIVFDFPSSPNLDVTETVKVLAGLARFVIADITDATEVRAELHNIIPDFTKLPVQPILLRGKGEFVSLPGHLEAYPWVLPTFEYDSQEQLIARLDEVIRPAETKVLELRGLHPE